jgi:hypothetical protein
MTKVREEVHGKVHENIQEKLINKVRKEKLVKSTHLHLHLHL